jgi:hypothetical protein
MAWSQFHQHFLCTKVLCAAFLYLRFGFVIFWQKKYWRKTKGGCKMLRKLTLVVNFINVLRTRFLYEKLAPKIQSQKVSIKKLLKNFHMKKACVKR